MLKFEIIEILWKQIRGGYPLNKGTQNRKLFEMKHNKYE